MDRVELSDDALDAVSGGYANNGVGQLFETPKITGGSGNNSILGFVEQVAGVVVSGAKLGVGLGIASVGL
jgi:hypothetical protein